MRAVVGLEPDTAARARIQRRLYDGWVHSIAQQLFSHISRHELLMPGDRVGVAVSGGIDSVALLRLLLELRFDLGIVLCVIHFNHQLREKESDGDEEFVRNLAREHDLEFCVDRADVAAHAREAGFSLETAARELRYQYFRSLIHDAAGAAENPQSSFLDSRRKAAPLAPGLRLDKVATGHTLDDQAETVLMRIIRGAGIRGLAAIYPRIEVEDDEGETRGEIVRPLLETRRCQLESYLEDLGQNWREDSTNADHHFTRNRMRKLVVPLLENEFNPNLAERLAELAEIAREEEEYWENEVAGWMGTAVRWTEPEWARTGMSGAPQDRPRTQQVPDLVQIEPVQIEPALNERNSRTSGLNSQRVPPAQVAQNACVDRLWFLGEPLAVQRRLIKAIAEHASIALEFKHIAEILHFAAENGPPGKELALPRGWKLLREPEQLTFVAPDVRVQNHSADYDYALEVPGRILVSEIGSEIEALIVERAGESPNALDALLSADILPGPLTIRNWRAGDRFHPAHTKSPKKLKELLTELRVPHTARPSWPVITSQDQIVWVRGFPVSSSYRAKAGQRAVFIREIDSAESG